MTTAKPTEVAPMTITLEADVLALFDTGRDADRRHDRTPPKRAEVACVARAARCATTATPSEPACGVADIGRAASPTTAGGPMNHPPSTHSRPHAGRPGGIAGRSWEA